MHVKGVLSVNGEAKHSVSFLNSSHGGNMWIYESISKLRDEVMPVVIEIASTEKKPEAAKKKKRKADDDDESEEDEDMESDEQPQKKIKM